MNKIIALSTEVIHDADVVKLTFEGDEQGIIDHMWISISLLREIYKRIERGRKSRSTLAFGASAKFHGVVIVQDSHMYDMDDTVSKIEKFVEMKKKGKGKSMDTFEERLYAFLRDYEEIVRKHRYAIEYTEDDCCPEPFESGGIPLDDEDVAEKYISETIECLRQSGMEALRRWKER